MFRVKWSGVEEVTIPDRVCELCDKRHLSAVILEFRNSLTPEYFHHAITRYLVRHSGRSRLLYKEKLVLFRFARKVREIARLMGDKTRVKSLGSYKYTRAR